MGVFDRQVATAKRLIARYGQACQWQKPAPEIEAEPGYPNVGPLPDPVPVRIAWFSPRDLGRGTEEFMAALVGTEVSGSSEIGLMEGGVPFVPDDQDSVIRDGQGLSIKKIDRLAPNGEPILYYVSVAA